MCDGTFVTPTPEASPRDSRTPAAMRPSTPTRADEPREVVKRMADAHVVENYAQLAKGVQAPGNLVIGRGVVVQGDVSAKGSILIAKGARILGSLEAGGNAVIGPQTAVAGRARAGGSLHVLDGAQVGSIDTHGDLLLRPGVKVGDVLAGGDLTVVGSPATGRVGAKGRIVRRQI